MKCILLCAGYGTRLYPLTQTIPKPLLTIGDETIVDNILKKICLIPDLTEIILVSNNKFYDQFVSWSKKLDLGEIILTILNDESNDDTDKLGAIGDLFLATNVNAIHEDVLIIAGDNLFEFDILKFVNHFKEHEQTLVAVKDIMDPKLAVKKYGVVTLHNLEISQFIEKPPQAISSLVATACYILKKEDINLLGVYFLGEKKDNLGDFISFLTKVSHVQAFVFTEDWFDIGSFEELERAKKYYENKKEEKNEKIDTTN
jgi:glucose-1-phosphate thymidylyltransferase